jgi:hypothetical protein
MSESSTPVFQRRRADSAGSTARALDWAARRSDILLHPHSPLALADVLLTEGGCFDLIATDTNVASDESGTEAETDATQTSGRRRKRRTRQRMNLLTLHTRDELQKRCRALTVENALVKQKHDQHLYLAAGFIEMDGMRAPVLLYPALLVHKPDMAGHEIRLADTRPEFNQRGFATLNERFGLELPGPSNDEPLSDYFALLAAAITPVPDLDFAFDIALGNASPQTFSKHRLGQEPLPDVPGQFDVGLAMSLASNVSLDELHTVLDLIAEAVPESLSAESERAANSAHIPDDVAQLRAFSVKLATRGLDNITFQQLPELAERINTWVNHITISRDTAIVADLFGSLRINTRQLARLGSIVELLDKAPEEFESPALANLAYASTSSILRRAQHQAQLIKEEFENLQNYFVLELVPSKTELLQLIDELDRPGPQDSSASKQAASDVVDADYFHARRRFMDFSRERPAHIEQEHRHRLKQLAKVLRFRELFVNNTEYRQSLGTHYRGLRTDWARLTRAVGFAQELAEVLGSEAMAAIAIADFPQFRRSLVADLDALRSGNDALREAIKVFGRQWETQPVEMFRTHLEETSFRLHEWRLSFGELMTDNTWTPAKVLSRFTGQRRCDAATEQRVRAARARIADTLRSGQGDIDTVTGTLEWLRTASRHATERQLDIGAIVDHLQIA